VLLSHLRYHQTFEQLLPPDRDGPMLVFPMIDAAASAPTSSVKLQVFINLAVSLANTPNPISKLLIFPSSSTENRVNARFSLTGRGNPVYD
jgi:hypothetical protein